MLLSKIGGFKHGPFEKPNNWDSPHDIFMITSNIKSKISLFKLYFPLILSPNSNFNTPLCRVKEERELKQAMQFFNFKSTYFARWVILWSIKSYFEISWDISSLNHGWNFTQKGHVWNPLMNVQLCGKNITLSACKFFFFQFVLVFAQIQLKVINLQKDDNNNNNNN